MSILPDFHLPKLSRADRHTKQVSELMINLIALSIKRHWGIFYYCAWYQKMHTLSFASLIELDWTFKMQIELFPGWTGARCLPRPVDRFHHHPWEAKDTIVNVLTLKDLENCCQWIARTRWLEVIPAEMMWTQRSRTAPFTGCYGWYDNFSYTIDFIQN